VSVVCLATIIVCLQLILMSIFNEENKVQVQEGGKSLNKVARVSLHAKSRKPGKGLGKILGVPELEQSKYLPDRDGKFKCLLSGQTFPFDRLNDNYCDCEDGTDEPSTSACATGTFSCQSGRKIPSSRVNDGVCDCCDGGDEYMAIQVIDSVPRGVQEKIGSFLAPCSNTCSEK